jgi:hypothetical protein
MYVAFDEWTQGRSIMSFGTNAGADELPFQRWRNFKEAYAPELVERAVRESGIPVRRVLDPFGGSGTTALASQFLGVLPTTVEVNPFLADLIEAKLCRYDADVLARDLGLIAGRSTKCDAKARLRMAKLPRTFVEPGVKERWIFDLPVAERIAALLEAIETLKCAEHRRLFRVLLGGIIVDVSNIVVSGKGRRYRRGWETRRQTADSVDNAFFASARNAINDIHRYSNRRETGYELIRGDARTAIEKGRWDLALFSPPYPNSFDYTDVYNVELWALGYLTTSESNRRLREATLSSHVQISRSFAAPPGGSPLLDEAMLQLIEARETLWDKRIPNMVGAYFADMAGIIRHIGQRLSAGGSLWLVVGDSRYAGIQIATGHIISELAMREGWILKGCEPFRSMRLSPQQGGRLELAESLIMLTRPT